MYDFLDDYDWREVFSFAGGETDSHNFGIPTPVLSHTPCDATPFSREDVEEILAYSEGENDALDWLIAGKLKDGRYFMIEAGCDYTGWD